MLREIEAQAIRRSLFELVDNEGERWKTLETAVERRKIAQGLVIAATFIGIAIVGCLMYRDMNKVATPLPKMVQIRKIALVNGGMLSMGIVSYAILHHQLHAKVWTMDQICDVYPQDPFERASSSEESDLSDDEE